MGHRDDLLVTHNLSEGKTHEPRPYPRGSVRRASGFVLTGYPEIVYELPTTRPESICALRGVHFFDHKLPIRVITGQLQEKLAWDGANGRIIEPDRRGGAGHGNACRGATRPAGVLP